MEKDGSLGMPDIYSDDAYAPDISFQPFQDMKFTLTFDSREEIPVGEDRYVTNIIFEVVKKNRHLRNYKSFKMVVQNA